MKIETKDNPLSNILVRRNAINEHGLREMMNHIQGSPVEDLQVFDPIKSNETGGTHWRTDKSIRDTQIVPFQTQRSNIAPQIEQLMRDTVRNIINPFIGIEMRDSEIPQILSYGIGGHYQPHIDAESRWQAPNGDIVWKKSTDRDLSLVFYLNDGYEGGDFVFPGLGIRVRPEPGMLIAFPSTHEYLHGVEPVTKGHRYAMVCWGTIIGFPTFDDVNREFSRRYGIDVTN